MSVASPGWTARVSSGSSKSVASCTSVKVVLGDRRGGASSDAHWTVVSPSPALTTPLVAPDSVAPGWERTSVAALSSGIVALATTVSGVVTSS